MTVERIDRGEWARTALQFHDCGREDVAAPGHHLQQLLASVVKGTTQLKRALHKRIVGHEGVRPDRLHEFLLADQPSGVFDKISKRIEDFWARLDLRPRLAHAPPRNIEDEFAELILQGICIQ
jgi:hypothetical protein